MARSKAKPKAPKQRPKQASAAAPLPEAVVVVDPRARKLGTIQIAIGAALVLAGASYTILTADTGALRWNAFVTAFVPALAGMGIIVVGCVRAMPASAQPLRNDIRRWIYGGLAVGFAVVDAVIVGAAIPNRLPSAALHLWTLPIFTLVLAGGLFGGTRYGWWTAIVGGSAVLLSTILMIVRILVSAAFLAGVYGAFGRAAASGALVAVALIVEVVALLPICAIRWLMSPAGRRAHGMECRA
jgi:hypothetical protein